MSCYLGSCVNSNVNQYSQNRSAARIRPVWQQNSGSPPPRITRLFRNIWQWMWDGLSLTRGHMAMIIMHCSRARLHHLQRILARLALAVSACLFVAVPARAGVPTPQLNSDTVIATAGFYHSSSASIVWAEPMESTDPVFDNPTTLYTRHRYESRSPALGEAGWHVVLPACSQRMAPRLLHGARLAP